MKIACYYKDKKPTYGVLSGNGFVTVSEELQAKYPTLRDLLAADAIELLGNDVANREVDVTDDAITYRAQTDDGGNVFCIGINYAKKYPLGGYTEKPDNIIMFGKFAGTLVAHKASVELPPSPANETFDYEGELAVVIGKGGRNISEGNAMKHVAGYTVMNDGSVRAWQKHSVSAGKNFNKSGAIGPWMVTADEIDDWGKMALSTRLNGVEVQSTTADQMFFTIPELIAYLSNMIELQPGDIIATGSPEGTGASRDPQRFLVRGDTLEIEWSAIGTLSNTVA